MSGQIRPLWPSIFQIAPRAGCEQIHVMIRSGVRSDSLVPTFPPSSMDAIAGLRGRAVRRGSLTLNESEALSLVWL
jgi:hypothetical protein